MARDRRRLYSGRFAHDAPLEGRRVWDVGDWGNASGRIGRRWEVVGTDLLTRAAAAGTLPAPAGATVISFVADDALQRRLSSVGLTNADALLTYSEGSRLVAAPVDFKWSIETASEKQVGASALEALFEKIPDDLTTSIREQFATFGKRNLTIRDGFFFSPHSRANDRVWRTLAAREAPFDVVFVPVESRAFFDALPGWTDACQLAGLDRRTKHLDLLDWADHYFRLGVGIAAARLLLERSIFDTVGEVSEADPEPLPLTEWRLPDSAAIVAWLSPQVENRKALARRLRDLLRPPYSLRDLVRDLAAWNPSNSDSTIPIPVPAELRERWEPVHRRVAERHRATVLAEGRRLSAELGSDEAALDQLSRRRSAYQHRARKWAVEVAEAAVG